jgi:hypothetical protein
MKQKFISIIVAVFLLSGMATAQNGTEFFISLNVNEYIPVGGDERISPIIGYNKQHNPKLSVGGFGIGVSILKTYSAEVFWKFNLTALKYKYGQSEYFTDDQNRPLGIYDFSSSSYSLAPSATAHYMVGEHFSLGAGVGSQIVVATRTKVISSVLFTSQFPTTTDNNYRRIMPTIPVECMFRFGNSLIALRYEQAILNRIRKDLAKYRAETFALIQLEFSFRLK